MIFFADIPCDPMSVRPLPTETNWDEVTIEIEKQPWSFDSLLGNYYWKVKGLGHSFRAEGGPSGFAYTSRSAERQARRWIRKYKRQTAPRDRISIPY